MKKKSSIFLFAILMINNIVWSQKEFKQLYEVKFPVSVDTWMNNDDQTIAVAGNDAALCALDAVTGKVLWQFTLKEKFGIKKCESWDYDTDLEVVEISCKGDKKDDRISYFVDSRTGETITDMTTKQKLTKTKYVRPKKQKKSWVGKGSLDLENPNVSLSLDYESPKINSSYDKKKKRPIAVSCVGEYTWTANIEGSFVRALCSNATGMGDFGGDFIDLFVSGNFVFVVYEGLSVIDLKTGKLLWETTFDFSSLDLGLMKTEMIIGRAPMPVCDASGAYIADLSKETRAIRKFDLATGKILWESQRLKKDAIITEMILIDGILMVRNGGKVQVQTYIVDTNGGSVCKSEMKEEGDFSLAAYDAATGKLLWVGDDVKSLGDKFRSISNLLTDGTLLYVSSDRNLFALDPKTGAPKYKVDISDMKIGKPNFIAEYESDIIIDGEEGLARLQKSDGKVKYATDTKKNLGSFFAGDVFYVWTGKDADDWSQFIRFNIETGAIEGGIKDTGYPYFSPDGNDFIKKDNNVLMRYSTKP